MSADPDQHVWTPRAGPQGITWQRGPGGLPPAVVPGPDGGRLSTATFDGQRDVIWLSPEGDAVRLTRHPAHDTSPAWDPTTRRVWFLSDRDVGVRALRLWYLPWPVERP